MSNNNNIDNLKDWFFSFVSAKEKNQPFWVLYRGRNTSDKAKIFSNYEDTDAEQSFEKLKLIIDGQSETTNEMTIVYKTSKTDPSESSFILKIRDNNTKISGVGNYPTTENIGMQEYIKTVVEGVKKDFEIEKIKMEHEREIERIEREASRGVGSKIGKVIENVFENDAIMGLLISKLLGNETKAQIGLLDIKRNAETTEPQKEQPIQQEQNAQVDYNLPNNLYNVLLHKLGAAETNNLFQKLLSSVMNDERLKQILEISKHL